VSLRLDSDSDLPVEYGTGVPGRGAVRVRVSQCTDTMTARQSAVTRKCRKQTGQPLARLHGLAFKLARGSFGIIGMQATPDLPGLLLNTAFCFLFTVTKSRKYVTAQSQYFALAE
jgi:hypothetical protein